MSVDLTEALFPREQHPLIGEVHVLILGFDNPGELALFLSLVGIVGSHVFSYDDHHGHVPLIRRPNSGGIITPGSDSAELLFGLDGITTDLGGC